MFKQFLDHFWIVFWNMFGSKLAQKVDQFCKAFLEPSWSHLESRLGPPGALLRGLMFQKHCKKYSPNACAQKRVLAPGDLAWATFQSHFGSFLAAFELQNEAKIAKKQCTKNESNFDFLLELF